MDPSQREESIEEMLEIGSSLREARVRRGLELPEVEAATLIKGRYIEGSSMNSSSFCPPARAT